MPRKRKTVEGDDSSSSRVVDEFSKLLKEQAKFHGEQIQQLLQLQNPGRGRGRVQDRPGPSSEGAYERFRKMNTPKFSGSSNPMIALEWIKAVEAISDYLQFKDKDRVCCASFLLTKTTRIWWEATKVSANVPALKCQEFKDLFFDKYFSKDVRSQKVKEFLELKQGSMTMHEYILKFEEGCQFDPYLAIDDTEKGEHFLRGVRAEIKRDVRMSKASTYKEIIEKALMAEQNDKKIEKERQLRRQNFPPKGHGSSQGWKEGFKGKWKEEDQIEAPMFTPTSSATDKPLCPKCNKNHKGECLVGSNKFYICGTPRHIAMNCPQLTGNRKYKGAFLP